MAAAPQAISQQPRISPQRTYSRTYALEYLSRRFLETPVHKGLAKSGGIIEVLTSKDGKTWTIIITFPNGSGGVLGTGFDWLDLERQPAGGKT